MNDTEHQDGEFASVVWDTPEDAPSGSGARTGTLAGEEDGYTVHQEQNEGSSSSQQPPQRPGGGESSRRASGSANVRASTSKERDGRYFIEAVVSDPLKKLEGTKEAFISYAVKGETNLPQYTTPNFESRRRFQDFVFLHDHLSKDFPACVVPPIPGKHRLEYLKGDRFGQDFVEKRCQDLNRFLHRLSRHPTLARSILLQDFLESTEWNIRMHQHLAQSPHTDGLASTSTATSLIDSLSDTLLNAFSKVRKPDERFLEVRDSLDKFEESLVAIERTEARARTRLNDLASDYEDFASSVQGLGYLESGITEPLARFETSLMDFAHSLRETTLISTESFLNQLHSLISYAHSFRTLLKLRDQKQLDFEELSAYLSNLSTERDRLANGYSANQGLGGYFKDKVESFRSGDPDITREGKIRKLDAKIKELQDAVGSAHDTSVAFDEEVLREHRVFQAAKRAELKELFRSLADGHIAQYEKSIAEMGKCQPALESIRVS